MPLVETESLILKTYSLAEADRIVVFLSREHGIVRGVAKGAKRLKSRFGSSLEPFSAVNITYFQKEERELVSVQSADLLRSSFEQAGDPAFLESFSYIADLLLRFTPPNDPNETLFRMLSACLAASGGRSEGLPAVVLYFELWLLRLGGYLPDWSLCEDCKMPFDRSEEATLRGGFHLHCQRCRKSAGLFQVWPEHREMFNVVQRLSPADFIAYTEGREQIAADLSLVMKRLLTQVLGNEMAAPVPGLARKNAV